MQTWIGPVVAALVAFLGSVVLTRGGVEARLLRRASQYLRLADDVGRRSTRSALREAAADDVDRALKLRATGRAAGWLGGSAIVVTVVVFAIPPVVTAWELAETDLQNNVWVAIFFAYVVLAGALWIAFVRVMSVRMKALD